MVGDSRSWAARRVLSVIATAFVVAGTVAVVAAVRAQRTPPQPPRSAAGTLYRPPSTVTVPAEPHAVTAPPTAPPMTTRPSQPVAAPRGITIPSIGVRSTLVRLGRNRDGSVQVPVRFDVAGWYEGSVAPGTTGPAVILGHVDSKSAPGVFFRLGALRPGDRVAIGRADGTTVMFAITAVRSYSKDRFPTIDVYGDTPTPTIRLITCGGSFDDATGHYRSNVVAFGQLVAP